MQNDLADLGLVDIYEPRFAAQRAWVEEQISFHLPEELRLLRPMKHFMTVARIPSPDKSDGGIFIPPSSQEAPGLYFPLAIGPQTGVGEYGRYEPYWDREGWSAADLRDAQTHLIGRCFLAGEHSLRELELDSTDRPMTSKFGLLYASDPWAEFAKLSYQHNHHTLEGAA